MNVAIILSFRFYRKLYRKFYCSCDPSSTWLLFIWLSCVYGTRRTARKASACYQANKVRQSVTVLWRSQFTLATTYFASEQNVRLTWPTPQWLVNGDWQLIPAWSAYWVCYCEFYGTPDDVCSPPECEKLWRLWNRLEQYVMVAYTACCLIKINDIDKSGDLTGMFLGS